MPVFSTFAMCPGFPCARFPICGISSHLFFLRQTNPGQENVVNGIHRTAAQGELFPLEPPSSPLTDEQRQALIPLLSIIVAAAMTTPTVAADVPRASHDE